MKATQAILLLLCSINMAYAQFTDKHAIYTSGELNFGNYYGFGLNLHYIHKNKLSLKLGYTLNVRKPRTQPADFSSGLSEILFFGLANPYDQFESYQIGIGQIYQLDQSETIRLNISIGIGYSIITEPGNWEEINNGIWTANYAWDYNKYHTVSLIINPKIEFAFSWIYGLTLSPMVQINKDRFFYGIGVGQMIGLLRKK